MPSEPESTPNSTSPPSRILVADQNLSNRRLIREILSSFYQCEVDDAANAEHAFERATQQTYKLFIFSFTLPDMSGVLLDRLISRVYSRLHKSQVTAPPVIFLVQSQESSAFHQVQRDARIRGSVPLPLNLDTLMNLAAPLLTRRS